MLDAVDRYVSVMGAGSILTALSDEGRRARSLGLTPEALRQLASLVTERHANAWRIADIIVAVYGPPPTPGRLDGSRARLDALADILGVSLSWLVATRITAAAWPPRDRRPSIAFPVHRALSARPDRVALLTAFAEDCRRAVVTPSTVRLAAWLAEHGGPTSTVGRPRLDPVVRIERAALALPRPDLARLVERLTAILDADAAA